MEPTVSTAAIRRYSTALLNSSGPISNHVSSRNSFCGANSSLSMRVKPKMAMTRASDPK